MSTDEGKLGEFLRLRQRTGPVCSLNARAWLRSRTVSAARFLSLLLLLTLPVVLQAQFTYTTNNGTITITGYTGPGGAVTIPSTITGLPVRSVGNYAFVLRFSVTSVVIPSSVNSIGLAAFAGCTNLTNITISDGVTSIGTAAFDNCISLANVTIPGSVANIGENAFSWCTNLISVIITHGVTNIGRFTFYQCIRLTNVTIPGSVARIGDYAFHSCTSLKGVFFKGNVPGFDSPVFSSGPGTTVYYLPGTLGWGPTFDGQPTALWSLPYPLILDFGPNLGLQTNAFGLTISWATNASVVVEACPDLANPAWSPVGTNTLVGGTSYFGDPEWANHPARFYRLRSP